MKYIAVKDFAEKFGISERTVRNYCSLGKIPGAFTTGRIWNIPENAVLPVKSTSFSNNQLLNILKEQKDSKIKGGIYHRTQIDLTYNSNHIEGSRLTQDQTRYIFETNTIGITSDSVNIDDIIETTNHFTCIDIIIDNAKSRLSERFIKKLHAILKSSTSESRKDWFNVGEYKKLPNEVGGQETTLPEDVEREMRKLIKDYNSITKKSIDDIIDFHYRFESIHPFQDGNGRVGRLIMFKECLTNNIVPFIIYDEMKMFYYRGLQQWPKVKECLRDTSLSAQADYKEILDYFRIS